MIASRNGVLVAWAIAGVLAVILLLTGGTHAPSDRTLVPGLQPTAITALAWDGPRGFRIEKTATGWRWTDPVSDADAQAIDDVLAALRGASWHRRAEVAAAGAVTTTLVIETGATKTSIGIGQPLGDEQRWLVVGEHALLVDAWVSRALAPDPVVFRVHPFVRVAQADQIEVGSFAIAGQPRRITKLAGLPIELLANEALVDQLERALGDVQIVALPQGKVPVDTNYRGTRIALDGKLVAVEAGMCPAPDRQHHAIFGPRIGPSCVSEAAWQRMTETAAMFDAPGDQRQAALAALIERRPVPFEPIGITLGDRSTLDLGKRPRVKQPADPSAHEADPDRVVELLGVLMTPAEPVALPASEPTATLVITGPRGVRIELQLFAGGIVGRRNEPIGLRVGDGSMAILGRGGASYVDRTLWSEEPTTIRSLKLGSVTYTRGVVVGEWTRTPTGAFDPASVEQLVGLLAVPRATGDGRASGGIAVTLSIVPPAGAASERTLLLHGTPCLATVKTSTFGLDPRICALAAKLQ